MTDSEDVREFLSRRSGDGLNRRRLVAAFVLYMAVLFVFILLKFGIPYFILGVNQKRYPGEMSSYHAYYASLDMGERFLAQFASRTPVSVADALANALAFVPLGFFLPVSFRGMNAPKTFAAGLLAALSAEAVQLLTGIGIADYVDIIFNAAGTAAGIAAISAMKKKMEKGDFARVVNGCALAAIVLLAPLLLFGAVNSAVHGGCFGTLLARPA